VVGATLTEDGTKQCSLAGISSELQGFIERVIVPALLTRLTREEEEDDLWQQLIRETEALRGE
jgi:uncharacterized membrane-anchored protein